MISFNPHAILTVGGIIPPKILGEDQNPKVLHGKFPCLNNEAMGFWGGFELE